MSFKDDIQKWTIKCASNSDEVVRITVQNVMKSIDYLSPVGNPDLWQNPDNKPDGYVGGHFRANWQLQTGSLPTGIIEGHEYKGALERELAKIPDKAAGLVFYYANNVEYAQALEDGHSQGQSPYGMVGLTAVRFSEFAEKAAAEVNK